MFSLRGQNCSPVEDQDLIIDRFSHQGSVLSSPVQAQTPGGQALSLRDLPRQPRCHTVFSGKRRVKTQSGFKGEHCCAKRWKKNKGPQTFCQASPVGPWWQGHVADGWGRHAGDLRLHWRIRDQPHRPAFQLTSPSRLHRDRLAFPGGVQQPGQAQHQQSSQHLKHRNSRHARGNTNKQTNKQQLKRNPEQDGDKSKLKENASFTLGPFFCLSSGHTSPLNWLLWGRLRMLTFWKTSWMANIFHLFLSLNAYSLKFGAKLHTVPKLFFRSVHCI